MYVLANLIGIFAVITWVISIQNKEKKGILIYQVVANIFYSIQYFLLGAYSACLMDLTSGLRCFVFYFEEKKLGKITNVSVVIFTFFILLFGIVTYNGFISILPTIASFLYMYSVWQNNLTITRCFFIFSASIWFCYNLTVGAHINLIGNILDIISGIISVIRFRRK